MQDTMTFKIPSNLKKDLEEHSEKEMTSQASIARKALNQYLSGADA